MRDDSGWSFVAIHKIRYTGMAMKRNAGYCEIEHTADWELLVWAPDLETLLQFAARGMYALSHTEKAIAPRIIRQFKIPFLDRESLLVDFLSELLFLGEIEGLAFSEYQLVFNDNSLNVTASGTPIITQVKEIKAITFHRMQIRETRHGLEVNIVFDV